MLKKKQRLQRAGRCVAPASVTHARGFISLIIGLYVQVVCAALPVGDVVVAGDIHHHIKEKSRFGSVQYVDNLQGGWGNIEYAYPSNPVLIPPRTDLIV
jgi:hypothetical protein